MYLNFLDDNLNDKDLVFNNDLFDEKSSDNNILLNSESFSIIPKNNIFEENFVESPKILPSENYSKDELSLKPENIESESDSDKDRQIDSKKKSTITTSSNQLIQSNIENCRKTLFKTFKGERIVKKKKKDEENEEKKDNNYLNKKRANKRKRGRQNIPKKKREHASTDYDNMLVKIQSHFLSFLIRFSNDVSATVLGDDYKYSFKNINRACKINIKYKYLNKIKFEPIEKILKLKINNKYKYFDENNNSNILDELSKKSKWLKNKFFKMNYLKLFNYYYKKENLVNKINIEGKNIILSKKTKTFCDLVDNNKAQEGPLIETVKSAYFNGYDELNPNISFTTLKNGINN